MSALRLLIYACGTPAEILDQQRQCTEMAPSYGPHEIVALAVDEPGETTAWVSACNMLCNGEVDRILVASRELVPGLKRIESITRELRTPPVRGSSPRHRRTRPTRRWGAGA